MVYRFSTFVLLFSVLLMLGCGDQSMDANEPEPEDPPPEDDLPTNVSYAEDIQPIFDASCGGAACHIDNEESGVELTTYDDVMSSEGAQYGEPIVDPGNPDGSPLVDKISSENPEFGARMPAQGDALSEDEIDRIRGWINEGAEDN